MRKTVLMPTPSSFSELARMGQAALQRQAARGFHRGPVPFGFKAVRTDAGVLLEEHPDEQILLKQAMEQFAAGASVRDVQAWLNAQGARSKRGRPFSVSSVHALLSRK